MNDKLQYYLLGVVVTSVIWMSASFIVESEDAELNYIINSACDGLEIYLEAAEDGKTLFAYWTYQTQETINFRITPDNVEIGQEAYEMRLC